MLYAEDEPTFYYLYFYKLEIIVKNCLFTKVSEILKFINKLLGNGSYINLMQSLIYNSFLNNLNELY